MITKIALKKTIEKRRRIDIVISEILVVILAIIGIYHIVEEIAFEFFKKDNEEFLKDFIKEYDKRNDNKN